MAIPLDDKRIQKALEGIEHPLELWFHPKPGHPLHGRIHDFATGLEGVTGGVVKVVRKHAENVPYPPGFTISYRGRSNVHYMAVPQGPELGPFLKVVKGLAKGVLGVMGDAARRLSGLKRECELLVFIAKTCHHCPRAVDAGAELALANPLVDLYVVDAEEYPDVASNLGVKSVPATFVDKGLCLVGETKPLELADVIMSRDTPSYRARILANLVERGRLEQAAGVLHGEHGAESLCLALEASTMNLRVGLMLALEIALEKRPECLNDAVECLSALLSSEDAALRGDTADILGRIGNPDAARYLAVLCNDPNPDVAEIACEALGSLGMPDRD